MEVLTGHGFDVLDSGGSFGGGEIVLRGPQETQFRARELVLRYVADRGWKIGWLADAIVLQDSWDQIGGEKGPWTRIAEVRHRVTSTQQVLARLNAAGLPTYFFFGETTDFIIVRCDDAVRAGQLLRAEPLPGVVIHDAR